VGKVRELLFGEDHNVYNQRTMSKVDVDMQGWASTSPSFAKAISIAKPKLIIEVGTWKGASAIHMAKTCLEQGIDDFEIVCIDTFLGAVEHWNGTSHKFTFRNGRPIIYDVFINNVVEAGLQKYITPFPVDAHSGYQVLKGFGVQADMIYIDASHDYEAVKNDIMNTIPLLRAGGVLLGDDYRYPDVNKAVSDTLLKVSDESDKFLWVK